MPRRSNGTTGYGTDSAVTFKVEQLPQLLKRADLLISVSDALRDLVASDVEAGIAPDRFSHPYANISVRADRDATKAGRTYKAAKKYAEQQQLPAAT